MAFSTARLKPLAKKTMPSLPSRRSPHTTGVGRT